MRIEKYPLTIAIIVPAYDVLLYRLVFILGFWLRVGFCTGNERREWVSPESGESLLHGTTIRCLNVRVPKLWYQKRRSSASSNLY